MLFSGDGDFVPVVEAMKRLGQHVVVGGLREACSPDLLIAGDDFVDLTPDLILAWKSHIADLDKRQSVAEVAE